MPGVAKDLTGQTFGMLTVEARASAIGQGATWRCRCSCGGEATVRTATLTSGKQDRCKACAYKVSALKRTRHGMTGTRLRNIWDHMKQRCNNPNDDGFKYYGGKGIKVCAEWLLFENFRDWALANGYDDTLTIDRINNERGYEPSNCRFVTQAENTRRAAQTRAWRPMRELA